MKARFKMYSYEIDEILRQNNYNIPSSLYLNIFNIDASPKITFVQYNPWEDKFYASTNDNYNWSFKVYKQ